MKANTIQSYTSANTSVNSKRLPAIYKKIDWNKLKAYYGDLVVLDIGAGKYTQHIKEYINSKGGEYIPYDPYNLSPADNLYAGANFHRATVVICSNVFNVIKEMDVIYDIHDMITKYKVPYFISVYEGDRSWIGHETKKGCWQRNETIDAYLLNFRERVLNKIITNVDYLSYIYR
ncbi:MAG: hypothetical protein ACI4S1_05290 [Roseburia sp.]